MTDSPPDSIEETRIRSLDDRFSSIEAEQQRQGGLLERLNEMLQGRDSDSGKEDTAKGIAAEVRRQLAARDKPAPETTAKPEPVTEKNPAPLPRRIERLMGWR